MRIAAFLLGFIVAAGGFAQTPDSSTRAHIRFTVQNPQMQPTNYSLDIYEDGSGSYSATYASSEGGVPAVQEVKQPIHIHDPLLSQLFQLARADHFFASDCADQHKRVAFTGQKTLAYSGPDGSGSCTFNYSRQQMVNRVTFSLLAISYTLKVGKRLQQEQRYDRLALESELRSLQDAVREGRALETENIAPELQAIADDDAVMNLARARARALLDRVVARR